MYGHKLGSPYFTGIKKFFKREAAKIKAVLRKPLIIRALRSVVWGLDTDIELLYNHSYTSIKHFEQHSLQRGIWIEQQSYNMEGRAADGAAVMPGLRKAGSGCKFKGRCGTGTQVSALPQAGKTQLQRMPQAI